MIPALPKLVSSPACSLPVDQDDIASPLLQVQGGADADHARAQHENIGLEFRHPALRKLNVTSLCPLPTVKLADCGSAAQTGPPPRKCALARRPNSGNMDRPWLSMIASKNGGATAEKPDKCRYVRPCCAATTSRIVAFAIAPASAQTLRYANQGELKSLDPYTLNESTTHGASRKRL